MDRVWGKEALERLIPDDLDLLPNDWQHEVASEQLYRVLDAWHIWRSHFKSSKCSDDLVRVAVGTFTLYANQSPCQKAVAACYKHGDKSTSADVSKATPLSLSQVCKAESPRGQPVELTSPERPVSPERPSKNYHSGRWNKPANGYNPVSDYRVRRPTPKWQEILDFRGLSNLGQSFDPPRSTSSRSSNDSWENLDSAGSQSSQSWTNLDSPRSQSWTNLDSPRSHSSEYELVKPIPKRRIPKLRNKKVPKEDNSLASIKEVTEDP